MAVLKRFSAPGQVPLGDEASLAAWHERVQGFFTPLAEEFTQFYDPSVVDTPAAAQAAPVGWPAFPATLLRGATSQEGRWSLAEDRTRQDEYCEWSVERDSDGVVMRVTFTTEVPEVFEHLAEHDPGALLALYQELVDPRVQPGDLVDDEGAYVRKNKWNASSEGRLAHLTQPSNTLSAAIILAAQATVQRVDAEGRPVRDQQILVRCGGLGGEFRNSDPRIASAVNNAAVAGASITLADPVGLYLDKILTAGMVLPSPAGDGVDPASLWKVQRGASGFAVRASFAVPEELGFRVGDILLDGRPIRFGAQLADRVIMRIGAVARPGDAEPRVEGCVG